MRSLLARLDVRLTLVLVAVTAVGMLVGGFYMAWTLEAHAIESLQRSLERSARLVHDAIDGGSAQGLDGAHAQAVAERTAAALAARVTVIAPDGAVLADSSREPEQVRQMENHASRPEVRAALAGAVGRDIRRSRTLDVGMLYVAVPLGGTSRPRGVIRLALPLAEVERAMAAVRRTVLLGAGLAIAAAVGVGLFVGRRVTRPVTRMRATAELVAAGDLDQRVTVRGGDEVAALGQALNRMTAALREKVESLEAQRAEVAAILNRMVEGVVALDDRTRVLLINPGARAILGLGGAPAADVEGRPLLEVVRQKALFDLVDACRGGADPEAGQGEIELGPPVHRLVRAQAVPVSLARQRTGTLLVLHDVTDLRRLERVRAEFVANVSHELRTPLTAIKGYLETLLDGALEDPAHARRFLETAHRHAERLGRLVDDLLQLSDVESGRVVLALEPVEVRAAAEGVAAVFEGPAARKRLRLLNEVPPGLTARADRDRLSQILVNLVDNAVKYTPDGGEVRLLGRRLDDHVEVAVTDTGIGIASTDLPRLTERFYRVDKARSRALGGTGLGLAIVKHLVHAQGGQLAIESEPGKGTTVRLTLDAA